jgi:hypothetical protein
MWIDKLKNDVSYSLQIKYNGDTYQSTPAVPLTTPEIDSVSWTQSGDEVSIFVSTHSDNKEPVYFMWNYEEDWEFTATYNSRVFYDFNTDSFYEGYNSNYYCWKNSRVNKILLGSTESLKEHRIVNKLLYTQDAGDDRFSELYCATLKQRAISKASYEYYQNKMKLNENMGGLFTPQPSEVAGNITCLTDPDKKVIGFVEVVGNTTQKSRFITTYDIHRPRKPTDCELILNQAVLNMLHMTYARYYEIGFRPVDPAKSEDETTLLPENWAHLRCTDCTFTGTKKRPSFWPDNGHY